MSALNLQNADAEQCLRVQAALQRRARVAHRAMSTEEQEIFDAAGRRLEELRSINPRNETKHSRSRSSMSNIEYIPGARLRHIDGTEATVDKTATADDYVVSVEDDGGFQQLWPRDEIAGFGVVSFSETDEIPFLIQQVIHTGNQTTIDVGVLYAIDAATARERAVANDHIKEFESFRVLSLNAYGLEVPEHFRAAAGEPYTTG